MIQISVFNQAISGNTTAYITFKNKIENGFKWNKYKRSKDVL